mmetsp:Transcript_18427/g.44186  ORF Transcript_18427/g.44186 Transcript_18427/m.44186 type:complete len:191 (-) Transcript_18427:331-903(-)
MKTLLAALTNTRESKLGAKLQLAAALFAGLICTTISNPIWVVNTRVKVRKDELYSGFSVELRKLVREEGLRGLTSGLIPAQILVINPGVQFMAYELLRRSVAQLRTATATDFFILGALSKMLATVTTYPLQVLKSRMQSGKLSRAEVFSLSGLYAGMSSKLVSTTLHSAVMFTVYEFLMNLLRARRKNKV